MRCYWVISLSNFHAGENDGVHFSGLKTLVQLSHFLLNNELLPFICGTCNELPIFLLLVQLLDESPTQNGMDQ